MSSKKRQSRLCVFCGQTPNQKTKEHVLPLWFIKAAGKPGDKTIISYDKRTGQNSHFPFEQMTLPACETCNSVFGKLESQAKSVFEKLFDEQSVSVKELTILLDWFDKVRLGLWLWRLAMKKEAINRRFHIQQRMGQKDRILFLAYFEGKPRGIGLYGINNRAFEMTPSCFGLAVNNLAFVNASFDYLLARNLGFPYGDRMQLQGFGEPEKVSLKPATGKLAPHLLTNRLRFPGFQYGQCIFHQALDAIETRNLYQTHVLKNSMEPRTGESHIFTPASSSKLMPMRSGAIVNPSKVAGAKVRTLNTWLPLEVAKIQRDLQNQIPDYRWQERSRRDRINKVVAKANLELDIQIDLLERDHLQSGGLLF